MKQSSLFLFEITFFISYGKIIIMKHVFIQMVWKWIFKKSVHLLRCSFSFWPNLLFLAKHFNRCNDAGNIKRRKWSREKQNKRKFERRKVEREIKKNKKEVQWQICGKDRINNACKRNKETKKQRKKRNKESDNEWMVRYIERTNERTKEKRK